MPEVTSEGLAEDDIRHPVKELTVSEEVMIQMNAVHKWYGDFHVLKDIDFREALEAKLHTGHKR